MISPADIAFAQANANFNYFGYLAMLAGLAIWLAWDNRIILARAIPRPSPALGLFALALGIRLVNLGAESLWYDESFTGLLIRQPLPAMLAATMADVHPPAYYLITRAIAQALGSGEFGLRFGPALFSAGAAVLCYILARDHLPEPGALGAGAAAAMLPGLVYYGQESRAYAMLAFLGLLCIWAARRGRWLAYGAALGLMFYTHNYGLLYGAVMLAWGLFDGSRRPRAWATLGAGVAYLPWLPVLAAQVAQVGGGYWIPPLLPGRAIAEPFLTLWIGYRGPQWLTLGALGAALALSMAGSLYVLRLKWPTGAAGLLFIALGPPLIAAVVSVALAPVYLPRGFILSAYLLIILAAGWLAQAAPGWLRVAAIAALAVMLAYHYSPAGNRRDDIRGAVDSLDIPAGAVIFHSDEQSYILFRYYAPQAKNILADYPADIRYGLSPATRAALGVVHAPEPEGADYLVIATGSGRPEQQNHIISRITPDSDPLITLYENSTQWGRVYGAN